MNIIYCKVWDKRTGTWVVASELAKGGKKTSRASASRAVASVAAFLVLTAATTPAWSAEENTYCVNNVTAGGFRCGADNVIPTGNSTYGTAVGYKTTATGNYSTALGANTNATAQNATAIGSYSDATGQHSTAVGQSAQATQTSATALGYQAAASGTYSTALGTFSKAVGSESTAIGENANANGVGAIALGGAFDSAAAAAAAATDSIAVGREASVAAGNVGGIAFGNKAKASATNTMALGFGAIANQTWAAAFGYQAEGSAIGALALGAQAYARGGNATALGTATRAIGAGSSAFGYGAWASGAGSISIGGEANGTNPGDTGPNVNSTNSAAADSIAIGSQARVDATTSIAGIAIGRGAKVNGAFGIAQGDGATSGAVGQNVAIGSGNTTANSSTAAGGAVAIGRGQNASGNGAVAIGDPNNATGTGAIALGADNTANGQGALAQGNLNNATGQGALALGNGNTASGQGAVALGNASSAAAAGAVALGDGASAGIARSVALGSGSAAAAAVATASTTIRGTVYNFAGAAPTSTVSVGTAGSERTVTNVAAGRLGAGSTDAVNGSQLFATNQAVQAAGAGFALTAQGANGSNVDPSESIDLRNADGNILVSKSGADNNVSFELADDIVVNSVTAGNSKLDNTGLTIAGGPKVTAAGIDAGGKVVGNVAAGVAASDGVNKSQLDAVAGAATSQGLNFTGNDAAAGTVHRDLGQTLSIAGDASTAGSYSGGNLKTVTDPATGAMKLQLADSPKFGNTVVNDGGTGKISGVTAGALSAGSTEAVNGSQLFQTNQDVAALGGRVSATEANLSDINNAIGPTDAAYQDANGRGVRYVRTNDTGIPQSDAFATGRNATAVGYEARASAEDTIAIGERAKASGISATAIGSNSQATANYAIALGDNNVASGAFSSALGDEARATDSYATAVGAFTVASSAFSTALGYKATTAGLSAVAIGNQANASALSSVAMGDQASASELSSLALGKQANASGVSAIAIGAGSNASIARGVALGSDSVADGAGIGVAAYVPPASTYAVAATAYNGEVSVGAAGSERRITHLAAGASDTDAVNVSQLKAVDSKLDALGQDSLLWDPAANGGAGAYNANHGGTGPNKVVNVAAADLSAASTDAVNGSQLFATNQAVQAAGAGFVLTAQGVNGSNVDPSESIDLKNGDGNIVVSKAATDNNVNFDLADDITVDSVVAGNSRLDNTGLTITGGPSVTSAGINAGNQIVSNVAAGVAATDAVNKSQLDAVGSTANAGFNITAQGANSTNVAPGETVDFKNGDGNIVVSKTGADDNVNFDLADDITVNSVVAGNSRLDNTGLTIAGGASVTAAGVNAGNQVVSNVAAGIASTDAVNKSQLDAVGSTANAGFNISAQGANSTNVAPGETVDFKNGDGNIVVSKTGADDNVNFDLADDIAVNSVVAGNSRLDNTGLTIAGGPSVTSAGIDAGNQIVSNVAAGVAATDAVNKSQLDAVSGGSTTLGMNFTGNDNAAGDVHRDLGQTLSIRGDAATAGIYSGANLKTVTDPTTGAIGVQLAESPKFGNVVINDGGAGKITGVTAADLSAASTDAVNGSQLFQTNQNLAGLDSRVTATEGNVSNLDNRMTTAEGDITNLDNRVTNVEGQMSSLGQDALKWDPAANGGAGAYSATHGGTAPNKIVNVAAADLSAASTDAVNGSQLFQTNQNVAGLDSRVTTAEGDITNLDNRVTNNEGAITNLQNQMGPTDPVYLQQNGRGTRYARTNDSGLPEDDAHAQGVGSTALGYNAVSSAADAVAIGRGAQASHAGSVALGAGSVADGSTLGNAAYLTGGTATGEVNIGNRRLTGVAAGANDTDAVNVAQLKAVSTSATQAEQRAVKYDWTDSNGNGQIDPGEVDFSKATLAGPASTDGGVTGGSKLTNLAQGEVSATSTDAVNGAQLYAVAGQSDAAYVAQNGRGLRYARSNDSGLAEADAHAQGVGSSAVGYNATAAADNAVAVGREAVASHANSVALGAGSATTAGAQSGYNGAYVGSSNSTGQVQVGGRTLGGLAAGSAADDAVNVAQLQAGVNDAVTQANSYTDARVAQVAGNVAQYDNRISTVEGDVNSVKNGAAGLFQVSQDNNAAPTASGSNAAAGGAGAVASGNGSTALGNGAKASGNNAVALGAGSVADQANTVSMGSAGGERRVTNIAAGVADTDAVNVSQLKGFTTGGVQYDKNADGSNNVNSLTFNPNGSGQTTLHNVAAGTAATDAVNVGQLQGGIKDAVVQANGYTDGQVAAVRSDVWKLGGDVRRLERDMQSGIAAAIAIKPAPYVAGRTTYYAGFGAYKSQAAFGVSLRRTADSGRWSVEGGASSNRDGTGVYLGVSGVLGD